jgi:hypothetical protein
MLCPCHCLWLVTGTWQGWQLPKSHRRKYSRVYFIHGRQTYLRGRLQIPTLAGFMSRCEISCGVIRSESVAEQTTNYGGVRNKIAHMSPAMSQLNKSEIFHLWDIACRSSRRCFRLSLITESNSSLLMKPSWSFSEKKEICRLSPYTVRVAFNHHHKSQSTCSLSKSLLGLP